MAHDMECFTLIVYLEGTNKYPKHGRGVPVSVLCRFAPRAALSARRAASRKDLRPEGSPCRGGAMFMQYSSVSRDLLAWKSVCKDLPSGGLKNSLKIENGTVQYRNARFGVLPANKTMHVRCGPRN